MLPVKLIKRPEYNEVLWKKPTIDWTISVQCDVFKYHIHSCIISREH